MSARTDDHHFQFDPDCPAQLHRLDMSAAARMSLAVLITAPPECALRIALKVAAGLREESADGVVIVHATDAAYLESALSHAAMGSDRRRAVVVQDVDALDRDQQSMFKRAIEEISEHGADGWRIITTTSVPLFERVAEGSFDAGLFYRLNTIHIRRDA
jgi:Mrp family chromosome partitioning ATPase